MTRLIGDIGGTNTRLALVEEAAQWEHLETYRNEEYDSLESIVAVYLDRQSAQPNAAALAVAGPVRDDEAVLTNRGWSISARNLSSRFGFGHCRVVNDFSAVALGIPALGADDVASLGGAKANKGKPIAILGPGTGLGVGGIVPCRDGSRVLVTEGGHASLPAVDARSAKILDRLRTRFGRVSIERAVSGQGMENIHRALCEMQGSDSELSDAAQIGEAAMRGDNAPAAEAMDYFFAFLGAAAGDLALTLGAFGGVYIAGGIVPRYLEAVRASRFREAFENKGRMSDYVREIPVFVILHEEVELLGLASSLVAREAGRPWPSV
ncbi:MAG: glucokinase [Gammaproteobacteria bacterium]|nr:glucokinase [Gammaproteobacteria bacterium]